MNDLQRKPLEKPTSNQRPAPLLSSFRQAGKVYLGYIRAVEIDLGVRGSPFTVLPFNIKLEALIAPRDVYKVLRLDELHDKSTNTQDMFLLYSIPRRGGKPGYLGLH